MGGDKKDDKSKEEAVRIHWSPDPVHANLRSYYKLASNILDYHKNFKSPSQEAAAGPKRARSSSSNADDVEDAGSGTNPAKKKREDNKGERELQRYPPLAAGQPRLCLSGQRSPLPSEPVRRQIQPQLRSTWRLQRLRLRLRLRGSPRRTWQPVPRPRKARRAALLLDRAATEARLANYRESRTSWKKTMQIKPS